MKRAAVYTFAVITLAFVFAQTTVRAYADTAPSKILTITPTTVKLVIDPGSSVHGTFQIINQGSQAYPTHIYSAPYSVQGEAYTLEFTPLPGHLNAAKWLNFSTTGSTIKPGQTFNVNYAVDVPTGTQPGGYYAVAFVETQAGKSNRGVIINERVGEIFYITASGPVKKSGKLLSWTSPFLQKPPLNAELRLENGGGVHYISNVHVSVQDIFGHAKYDLTTQKAVLPQTIRRLPINWNKAPALGLFKVVGSVTILSKAQPLNTEYVLVASQGVRIGALAIIGVLAAFLVGRVFARHRHKQKQSSKGTP